jgi:hypothetical protein
MEKTSVDIYIRDPRGFKYTVHVKEAVDELLHDGDTIINYHLEADLTLYVIGDDGRMRVKTIKPNITGFSGPTWKRVKKERGE